MSQTRPQPRTQRVSPSPSRRPENTVRRPDRTVAVPANAGATGRARSISLPIDVHRAIAAFALVLLLLMTLLAPLSPSAPDQATFITPNIDGSGSVAAGFTEQDIEQALFPFQTIVERSATDISSVWPDLRPVLSYAPDSLNTRRAIVGQLYASSTGALATRLKDTGLESNPPADKIAGVEAAYQNMTGGDKAAQGINGLSAMLLLRSLKATPADRKQMEIDAIDGFQTAINVNQQPWQFTYNWGLANFLAGNYGSAYASMLGVISDADKNNDPTPRFWLGLAALRMGDTGEAIADFKTVTTLQPASGSNDAAKTVYDDIHDVAQQALGDAQWANRDPAAAYDTYFELLQAGSSPTGLYSKWLRLGIQQRAYDRLVNDLATLEDSRPELGKDARIHHDRARLLSMLGRDSEANGEYQQAIQLSDNDPAVLVSYGQALEAKGDHSGALFQAQSAIKGLGKDLLASDLSSVAEAAVLTTTNVNGMQAAQQLLDAHLLRARVWGKQGQQSTVSNLVSNMTANAGSLPANESGLLQLYGAYAYEAAGMNDKAAGSYSAAWDKLKGLPAGSPGRAAALAGLARATAASKGAQAALDIFKSNSYDLASLKASVIRDPDAPDILYQQATIQQQAGQNKEAANTMRVAEVVRNDQDVHALPGLGRPVWSANGTIVPANGILDLANMNRTALGVNDPQTTMRYKQAYSLDPSQAAAWNNIGVAYANAGNNTQAQFYLSAFSYVSPDYALGQHNLAALGYNSGLGNFFTAEGAQGEAIKANGPQTLQWGYNMRYDDRGPVPAPSGPSSDFLSRLPAILILALLLAHTIVGNDRMTNRMGLVPTRGVLGRLAQLIDPRVRETVPALVTPGSGTRGMLVPVAIASVIGMFGLAWGAAHGSFAAWLVFLPVALIAAVLAFGANELAQYIMAGREGGATLHHTWPLGTLLGIVSIPFGFVYGWQIVTRVQPGGQAENAAGRSGTARRSRTSDEMDLAYEAQVEAAADANGVGAPANSISGGVPVAARVGLSLSPATTILFAGLVANLAIGLLFGLFYWLTGWPSMRLAMFASMLVLVFTAVSEPPADGWALYRRNAPLWMALFVLAATVVTLLAIGIV